MLLSSVGLVYAQTIEELRDSMAAGNLNMQVDLAIMNYGHLQGKPTEENFIKRILELSNGHRKIPANATSTHLYED